MNNQALKYYMHDGPSAFRFELEGQLTDESARRLEQDWITASSVMAGRTLIVDMTFVTAADEAGRELLGRWHASGARLVAASKTSRSLAESIIGGRLPEYGAPRGQTIAEPTWLPFRSFSEGTQSGVRRLALPYRGMTVRDKVALPNWTPSRRSSHTVLFALLLFLFPTSVNGAPNYIRQLIPKVNRFSCFATSGTNGPNVPCQPSGDVVPPRPAKKGTLE